MCPVACSIVIILISTALSEFIRSMQVNPLDRDGSSGQSGNRKYEDNKRLTFPCLYHMYKYIEESHDYLLPHAHRTSHHKLNAVCAGVDSTHLHTTLSLILLPCVKSPGIFTDLINTCSIVISDQTRHQNLPLLRIVK